jgi:hypothetical protein
MLKLGKTMTADEIIIIGVVIRELAKEGVGQIQAERIGKAVAKALGALHATNPVPNRHI